MHNLLTLIAPKFDTTNDEIFSNKLEKAFVEDRANFEQKFLDLLLEYKLVVIFDNTISLEELLFKLRQLILTNHINVTSMGDDKLNEFDITDHQLNTAGAILKKQGWLVVDFDRDPTLYYLSVIPLSSKAELQTWINQKGLFLQIFE